VPHVASRTTEESGWGRDSRVAPSQSAHRPSLAVFVLLSPESSVLIAACRCVSGTASRPFQIGAEQSDGPLAFALRRPDLPFASGPKRENSGSSRTASVSRIRSTRSRTSAGLSDQGLLGPRARPILSHPRLWVYAYYTLPRHRQRNRLQSHRADPTADRRTRAESVQVPPRSDPPRASGNIGRSDPKFGPDGKGCTPSPADAYNPGKTPRIART